jgi:phage replication O-like protein O
MNNPQIENGYTKIANEIIEALMRINLSSYQSRLLWAVFRKTYGFNKKEDWLSNSQIVEMTGLRKQHVSRAKKELIERKIVTSTGNKIQFNKDYSQWCELPKPVAKEKVTDSSNAVTDSGYNSNQYRGTQKKKETYTKEISKDTEKSEKIEYGNEEINNILKAMKLKIGVEEFADSQKWQRIYGKHCYNLMQKITPEEFSRRLDILLKDNFKRKRMNEIKYVYGQVKGFIEPKNNIAFIS